jgi:group I intron endonuclease
MKSGIYKITSPSNKIYIGQSWDIDKRKIYYKNSLCKEQPKIYNSIKKYGWMNHKFEIIEEVDTLNQNILNEKEVYWIKFYRNIGFELLNLREGGSNGKHSLESKNKIGLKVKGKNNGMYGKTHTDESKKLISQTHKGKKISLKTRKKISEGIKGKKNPMYGKTHSYEIKKVISNKMKNHLLDKNNHPMYGKHHTNEAKKKISDANLGKSISKEIKDKISKSLKHRKKNVNQILKRQKKVVQFNKINNFIKVWDSIKEAGDKLKINKAGIVSCCKGRLKTAGGFKWSYLN